MEGGGAEVETATSTMGHVVNTRHTRSHLTWSGQPDYPSSPGSLRAFTVNRNVSVRYPLADQTGDPMGNRKWSRGVRGCPVHLAYVKFTSGLPRNYHCRNLWVRER